MNSTANKTLSQLVVENYQSARVFEKYGLDFCCKGKRPLEQACQEKQISLSAVLLDLEDVQATNSRKSDFNEMSLTELTEYIVRVHHTYVRNNMPEILAYVNRVATKHADRYPFMVEVSNLFENLVEEMTQHMFKEEKILFPRIKLLELGLKQPHGIESVQTPIEVMEQEHDHAGNTMQKIRELTNNYTAPESACTTFRLSLSSLQAFEQDLHEHVHLENNILFPKAIERFNAVDSEKVY